jgi:hypothetical protein
MPDQEQTERSEPICVMCPLDSHECHCGQPKRSNKGRAIHDCWHGIPADKQEQTERGASTVFVRFPRCENTNDCYERQRIQFERGQESMRADLERVTAERDQLKEHTAGLMRLKRAADEAAGNAEAERDAMRVALLKIEEIASRPSIADEERMSMVWQIVVLSLDAARKATADTAEKGK